APRRAKPDEPPLRRDSAPAGLRPAGRHSRSLGLVSVSGRSSGIGRIWPAFARTSRRMPVTLDASTKRRSQSKTLMLYPKLRPTAVDDWLAAEQELMP